MLAHGPEHLDILRGEQLGELTEKLSQSNQAYRIYTEAREAAGESSPVVMWLIEWSDDFEPNNVKQNRGSVWAYFVTCSTPHGADSAECTFLVAIGPKDADHSEVLRLVNAELERLAQPRSFYWGGALQTSVLCVARMLSSWADTPERYKLLALRQGTEFGVGTSSASNLVGVLPCEVCCAAASAGKSVPACEPRQCQAFSPLKVEPAAAPKNFPEPNARITPVEQTFKVLNNAVDWAYDELERSPPLFSPASVKAFLTVYGINSAAQENICSVAALRVAARDSGAPMRPRRALTNR